MAIGFGRAIASALGGTLEGLAEAAVREDEKRDELSKVVLAQRIKNSEKALELSLEQTEALKEENDAVSALMTIQVGGKPMSRAEATQVYRASQQLKIDPVEVLEKFSLESEAGGQLVSTPAKTRKVAGDDTAKMMAEEEEDAGFIRRGRAKSVDETATKLLRAAGYSTEIEIPQAATVTGVTLKPKPKESDITRYKPEQMPLVNRKTGEVVTDVLVRYEYNASGKLVTTITDINGNTLPDEYKNNQNLIPTKTPSHYTQEGEDKGTGTEAGTFSFINPQTNTTETVPGRFNVRTGLREIWSVENNKFVEAPANYTWEGALPTQSKDVTEDPNEFFENITQAEEALKNNPGWNSFKEATGAYANRRRGARQFADLADLMAQYAQDPENYSMLFTSVGALSSALKVEAAGLGALFPLETDKNGNPKPTELDAQAVTKNLEDESLNLMEALDNGVLEAAEIANTRKKLIQNIALRMAIAEIRADNESRPSDFDVKARLEQYLAKTPRKFAELMKTKAEEMQIGLKNDALSISENSVYTTAVRRSQDPRFSPEMQNAYTALVSDYAPVETPIEGPKFLQEENALEQFSDEDVTTQDTEKRDIQVPLNIKGITKSEVVGNNIVYTFVKDGQERTRSISLDDALEKKAISEGTYNQYTSKD